MRRILLGSTALLVAALALAGCSAGSADISAGDAGPGAPVAEPGMVDGDGSYQSGGEAGGDAGGDAGGESGGDGSIAPADREVVVTGEVTITADDPLAASRDAVRIVETAGGRVDGRNEYAPADGDKGSATLVLRIPADKLTATLDKLEELGSADEVSLSSSDVTAQSRDLDARITALTASIERLNALVAKASSVDDLIRLETEVSNRQAELESLQALKRSLADQVSMSTISLYLRSVAEAPKTEPADFWTGLGTGWDAFVGFWAGVLVVLGLLLPWIVTAAIVTFVVMLVLRRRRARRPAPDLTSSSTS